MVGYRPGGRDGRAWGGSPTLVKLGKLWWHVTFDTFPYETQDLDDSGLGLEISKQDLDSGRGAHGMSIDKCLETLVHL